MKKFLSLILIIVVIASIAGCGAKKEETAAPMDTSSIKMGRINYAAHGTKSFAVVVVAMAGDKIAGASIDEFQFMSTDVATGVPNSDAVAEGDFGSNYKDPSMVLASKADNSDYYSEHMKEEAGSTVALKENYVAIEAYVTGKTVEELEETLSKNDAAGMVDAVSGATLQDTKGYVSAIVEAAKTVK